MYHLTADSEVVFFLSLLCGMGCWYIFFVEVWADAIAWILIRGGEILKSRWAFGGSPGFAVWGRWGLLLVRQLFSPYFFISFGILVCIRFCRSCTLAFRPCIRLYLCILVCTFERPCRIFELLCRIFALPCRTFGRLCRIFALPCRIFWRFGRIFALLGRTFRQRFYILCLLFHIFGQHKFASYIAV